MKLSDSWRVARTPGHSADHWLFRSVEVCCARDHRGEGAGLPLIYERSSDPRADFPLLAARIERRLFRHRATDFPVHVHVAEEA